MRAKKSLKNLIFNVIQQLIGILTGFLLPPLIISNYGSSINGLIQTIKQTVTYAQTTGAGIASASTYVMYKPLADKNYKKLSGIFNATKKMFIKAGNYASFIMLMVAFIYPLFVSNDVNPLVAFLLVIMLGLCGVSEFYFIGKYQALFSADQKNYLVSIAQGLGNIFNIIISIVLIKLKCNIVLVEFGAMTVYITRVLFLWIHFKRHYAFINKDEKPLFNAISQRKDAVIHEITALVVNNSSVLLVSLILGLANASVFSVYLLVFSGLNMLSSIVSNGIYASFGDVIAKKETDVLQKSYNVFEWGFFIAIFTLYIVTFVMIMPFISIYTRNMTDINYSLPVLGYLFVLVGILNNIKVPARMLVNASGHFKQTKKYAVVEMLLNIIGQLIFIPIFGIYGALIGCLLAVVYRTCNFIWYTNKYLLQIKHIRAIRRIVVFAITSLMLCYLSTFIDISTSGYLAWLLWSICITAVTFVILLIVGIIFDKSTFKDTIDICKKVVSRG